MARLIATLYLFLVAPSIPSPTNLRGLFSSLLSTKLINITFLSSPWKLAEFPHKILWFSISTAEILLTIKFWINSACSSPSNEITPNVLFLYSSISKQASIRLTIVSASVLLTLFFSFLFPSTLYSTIAGFKIDELVSLKGNIWLS